MQKVIYSLRVNLELQKKGFIPILEMSNPRNKRFNCWVYEETEAFKKAFDSISSDRRDRG